ncbi:hypothetical protein KZ810_08145 [Sphingomonas sp. RHCKR47]|uniref:hypothetical protein n=1 Tax=Sphingomonas citricola TaxID=2862498 RepID=UPI001CA4792A|nr:hypothetical protein [Sphingomonas citricola]MBW6523468.1 hypothetical protein [Sphingomonas citricola]
MTVAPLTTAMRCAMSFVAAAEPKGHDAPEFDRTLVALSRRGLVEWRTTRAKPRVYSWHLTVAGKDWHAEDRKAFARVR